MEFWALADLFGFAVSIDGFANAYRVVPVGHLLRGRRLMLQSHSRMLFLLVLEAAFGFLEAHQLKPLKSHNNFITL